MLNAIAAAPLPAIVVRAWIGPNGAVTRVEFASLGDPDADATLPQLLTVGRPGGTAAARHAAAVARAPAARAESRCGRCRAGIGHPHAVTPGPECGRGRIS
ncbi:hypothetical protein [Burkholderia cepacia]|uniref:hypothetical protein n=1 Tax=Burkholderia cepacia TaxID=292 RepID=UPI003453DBB2